MLSHTNLRFRQSQHWRDAFSSPPLVFTIVVVLRFGRSESRYRFWLDPSDETVLTGFEAYKCVDPATLLPSSDTGRYIQSHDDVICPEEA